MNTHNQAAPGGTQQPTANAPAFIDFGVGDSIYLANPTTSSANLLTDLECLLVAAYDSLVRQPDDVDGADCAGINLIRFCVGITRELRQRGGQ